MGRLLLCLGAWVGIAASAHAGEPAVGELHPELRLPTIDGKQTVSVRGQRGRKVLLIEFASW